MKKTKRESEREHFRQRLYERYGLLISNESVNKLCQQIKNSQFTILEKQTNRIRKYLMVVNVIEVVAIYDRQRGMLVTALPKI